MTVIPKPPEGYEILPAEGDEALDVQDIRFRAPDGEIVTLEDLRLAGLIE